MKKPQRSSGTGSVQLNFSTFADAVIEGMGWPDEFERWPLLRSALEYALAWTFEKYLRGDIFPVTAGNFAARALDIADNHVTGPCDLIDQWEGRQGIRRMFEDAARTAFAALPEKG